jgi:uncharacterized protein (TIGR02996 family)
LLEAWRARRLDETAAFVELVSERLRQARVQPAAKALEAAQEQWLEIEARRDPADVAWLLKHIVTARRALSVARLHRIARWPDDPRVVPALLALAGDRPFSSQPNRPFWTRVFRELTRRADRSALAILSTRLDVRGTAEFDHYLVARLRGVAARLERLPPPPSPDAREREILDAIGVGLRIEHERTGRKTAEDFLREIWSAPLEDAPRAVFADWLLERGDARGELIVLQLRRAGGSVDAAGIKRERALLADRARAWMGPLEPAVHSTAFRFERGFLAACRVVWRRLVVTPGLMTHPAWATVREYELDAEGERACDEWLDHMIALGAKRR